ncbi:hypothetical protein [Pseudobacteriovorax antillogorgiicola]|uniref:Uncharacterized protein n=1 Tax=Pseudobacteriovorax antillogorgiicola TaxID=1513793 RepID=A0A1Y6CT33_9BACT|nr:hypothetical protein [Pseudobacteriovorax antillogorgiicola]TCS44807.1 hypothetical protein EDD56_13136 [Pseudobacteriovorax antillogorgiicola]SMF77314.1 hypothetical protein SAMN06296036_13128 [Pseudobacteriovorax antillogorgiicola]
MSVLSSLQERFGAQLSSYSYDIILALSVLGFGAAAAFLVKKVSF